MMDVAKTIEEAIYYAKKNLGLREEDEDYIRNTLLSLCGLNAPSEEKIDTDKIDAYTLPDPIFDAFVSFFLEKGKNQGEAEREATRVMGILTPAPSVVDDHFFALSKDDAKKATDYLYDLSIKNCYIAKSKVDKNIYWDATHEKGSPLEISINLSKPEKNNKDIAKLLKAPVTSSYPSCLLCRSNIGFEGNDHHPARENIRFIPLSLNGERWYLQYSPYVYYSHHCICFYEKHVPMEITPRVFSCLFSFVDQFPHYFIGSNSDLPIVGGSILNHEHFQGGGHLLPLLKAPDLMKIKTKLKKTELTVVDFYNTVLKLKGTSKEEIIAAASKILSLWRHYDDPSCSIISNDESGNHSTITPIVRKEGQVYSLYLILRNNRCDKKYPDGIFHAHPQYHHIKKEGIGLIEAAGLFILPARIKRQSVEVEDIVKRRLSRPEYLKIYPDLEAFGPMIEEMEESKEDSRTYINSVCRHILQNVAVYKDDANGRAGLARFIKEVDL